MDYFRVIATAALINTLLSLLVDIFVFENFFTIIVLTLWTCVGYTRVFGKHIAAPTWTLALKGVLMSMAWPLVPPRR